MNLSLPDHPDRRDGPLDEIDADDGLVVCSTCKHFHFIGEPCAHCAWVDSQIVERRDEEYNTN